MANINKIDYLVALRRHREETLQRFQDHLEGRVKDDGAAAAFYVARYYDIQMTRILEQRAAEHLEQYREKRQAKLLAQAA